MTSLQKWLNTGFGYFYSFLSPKYAPYDPPTLNVEITTRCNLECEFCYRSFIDCPPRDLAPRTFKRILQAFPRTSKISFIGLGEPLLNPDLSKLIRIAKNDGRKVDLTTNCILVNQEEADELVNVGVDEFFVSLNRAGGRRWMGLKNILEAKKKKRSPRITIQTVAMNQNMKEFPQMWERIQRLGVETWSILHHYAVGNGAQRFHALNSEHIGMLDEIRSSKGLHVISRSTTPTEKKCYAPRREPFITTKGEVRACSFIGALQSEPFDDYFLDSKIEVDPTNYVMGKVFQKNIWNSEDFKHLRSKLSGLQSRGEMTVNEYKKLREKKDEGRFSYCEVCQNRFGMAC